MKLKQIFAAALVALIASGGLFAQGSTKSKTLVVYFSWSGTTEKAAQMIAKSTGADLFRIEPTEVYPTSYKDCADIVKKELDSGKIRTVKSAPDFSKYDTIFVGSPIWWYTAAPVVLEFLKEFDFQNKNVVPFSTQGSNYGTYFEDFKAKAKNANILKGEAFNNLDSSYNEQVKNKIISWLNSL